MKTKVAIVLMYFGNGGAENMVAHLVSHLNLDRFNVRVFCVFGNPQNNHLEEEVRSHGVDIIYIGKKLGFSFKAFWNLYKELNKFKPDVVHTHGTAGMYTSLWAMTHKVKVLHTVHNMPQFELGKEKRKVMALMYRTGKAIPVGISHTIQHLIAEMYKVKGAVELVYNPVDIERFACLRKVDDFNGLFITAGRLDKQKNQELLIRAFKRVTEKEKKAKLFILGEGPLRKTLEEKINAEHMSDNIELLGNVTNIEQYFAKADAFVLSSDYEGLPLVLLEAMASGLPIVSTDVGGVKDIVTDNGILVDAGDEAALTSAMLNLAEDKTVRKKLSENALNNVKQYDVNNIAEQYERLYLKYSQRQEHKRS